MLAEEELKGVPLLVFCNKQDIEGALKPEEISEQLGLAGGEKSRPWSVRGSSATKGEGLEEGLDWYVAEQHNPVLTNLSSSKARECHSTEVISCLGPSFHPPGPSSHDYRCCLDTSRFDIIRTMIPYLVIYSLFGMA